MTIQNIHGNKPDAIIAMPMTIPDSVYEILKQNTRILIMSGGLGVNKEIIDHVLDLGIRACAVTDRDILDKYES